MTWKVLDTGKASAEENMRFDATLLENLHSSLDPILHFYDWNHDSATYGHFLNPSDYLDLARAKKRQLSLAKRPTGGGIVFHLWDLAFSVLVPASSPHFSLNTLDNYAFVNNAVMNAVKEFLAPKEELTLTPSDAVEFDPSCQRFCMAKPTKYDVMLQGRKIAGAAQRKTKEGFLHQGTISLVMPPEGYLEEVLLPQTRVLEAMKTFTFPLLGANAAPSLVEKTRQEMKGLLQQWITLPPS